MATTTADTNATPTGTAEKPKAPLWAAPVFLVGVGSLVLVALLRPTLGNLELAASIGN